MSDSTINGSSLYEIRENPTEDPRNAELSTHKMQEHITATKRGWAPIYSEYYDNTLQGRAYSKQVGFDPKRQSLFLRIVCYFSLIRALFRWMLHSSIQKERDNILLKKKIDILSGEEFLTAIKTWDGTAGSLEETVSKIQEQFHVFSRKKITRFLQSTIDGKQLAALEDMQRIANNCRKHPNTYKTCLDQINTRTQALSQVYNNPDMIVDTFTKEFDRSYFPLLQQLLQENKESAPPLAQLIVEDIQKPANPSNPPRTQLRNSYPFEGQQIQIKAPLSQGVIEDLSRDYGVDYNFTFLFNKTPSHKATVRNSPDQATPFLSQLASALAQLHIFQDIATNKHSQLMAQLLQILFEQRMIIPFAQSYAIVFDHLCFILAGQENSHSVHLSKNHITIQDLKERRLKITRLLSVNLQDSQNTVLATFSINTAFELNAEKAPYLFGPEEYNSTHIGIELQYTEEGKAFLQKQLLQSPTGDWNKSPRII